MAKPKYKFVPESTRVNGLKNAINPSKSVLTNWIGVLERRINNVEEILDSMKIPNRIKVQGDLYAGLQTAGRVELLIKKLSKKK